LVLGSRPFPGSNKASNMEVDLYTTRERSLVSVKCVSILKWISENSGVRCGLLNYRDKFCEFLTRTWGSLNLGNFITG
jgi:hypothetical protein